MHIPDILPAPVAIAGYGLTGLTTWLCLKRIDRLPDPQAQVPKASLLTAAFFVASWIHVPTPLASVHFILNGLLGVLLGWFAFPAILIGLLFQAVMFQHGGLSTLGVNALVMGIPALMAHFTFQMGRISLGEGRKNSTQHSAQYSTQYSAPNPPGEAQASHLNSDPSMRSSSELPRWLLGGLGFVAGALGLGLSVLAFFSTMIIFLPTHLDVAMEQRAIALLCLAYLPVIALEGGFTAMLVLFLQRVKPELLPTLPKRRPQDTRTPNLQTSPTPSKFKAMPPSPALQEGNP